MSLHREPADRLLPFISLNQSDSSQAVMVVSHVAAASTGLAGIRRFSEEVGMGSAEHRREGAKGDAAALSSKGPAGCRAGAGTGCVHLPRLGTYRQNIVCNLPQLRRWQNVSAPSVGHGGSFGLRLLTCQTFSAFILRIFRASLILSFILLIEPSLVPGLELEDCQGEQKKMLTPISWHF